MNQTEVKPAKKKRNWRLIFYMLLWMVLIGVFTGAIAIQASGYNHYRREYNQALTDLENEKKAHTELLDRISFYESDAYIEQIAREQLGFVRPDELVFVNIAD